MTTLYLLPNLHICQSHKQVMYNKIVPHLLLLFFLFKERDLKSLKSSLILHRKAEFYWTLPIWKWFSCVFFRDFFPPNFLIQPTNQGSKSKGIPLFQAIVLNSQAQIGAAACCMFLD